MEETRQSLGSPGETLSLTAVSTSCKITRRSWSRSSRCPAVQARVKPRESVPPIHHEAGSDVATDGRHLACRQRRVLPITGLSASRSRLSNHPGPHFLSGSQPLRDGYHRARSTGEPVRRTARSEPDDFHQFWRPLGDRAAVQFNPEHRRSRGRSTVGDQRVSELPAFQPANSAGLQQDKSGRRAGAYARHHIGLCSLIAGGRSGGYPPGSKAFAIEWSWAGKYQWRTEAGGALSRQPCW